MWHGDPKDLGIMAEERWARAFEEAANRRLLQVSDRRGFLSGAVQRAQSYLEQKFYFLLRREVPASAAAAEEPSMPDAELVRLLALLAPDGQVLHVERVRRSARQSEDGEGLEAVADCRR
jgi:hypothetical protein